MPPFLWLRLVTGQRLAAMHRKHLGAQMRDADLEVSLHRGVLPQATSVSLAELILGRLTSPTRAARRAEMQVRLQEVLNSMDPIDREVLTLRHFEDLSNGETAQVLGLSKSAASNRYMRALLRLRETLAGMPGFIDP
jgi:RNA polymerase sigma-70 factor (ECF subfamily)